MKQTHHITVIFGTEAVKKYFDNTPFNAEEQENCIKTFTFSSKEELYAFTQGLDLAKGWLELVYEEKSKIQLSQ